MYLYSYRFFFLTETVSTGILSFIHTLPPHSLSPLSRQRQDRPRRSRSLKRPHGLAYGSREHPIHCLPLRRGHVLGKRFSPRRTPFSVADSERRLAVLFRWRFVRRNECCRGLIGARSTVKI